MVFFILFCISLGVIVFHFLFFRIKLLTYKEKPLSTHYTQETPISIIICAKNEEVNLKENLESILEQNYSNFEVIVVDDNSTDESYYYLKSLQQKYNNLQIIKLSENVNFFKGKKFPLSIGVRSAKHNHLLLTDADCKANSENWIRHMASKFSENKQIVLGYGKYKSEKTLLNILIRFETLYTACNYFSFAMAGVPYMGVGRNLAYAKDLFIKNKGFSKHYTLTSGDDDLFVNSVANKKNISYCINNDATTISSPKKSFVKWWKQKRRHMTTGFLYKKKHKILLSIYPLSILSLYTSFVFTLIFYNNIYIVLSLFLIHLILHYIYYIKTTRLLSEMKLYLFSLIFEIIIILLYGIVLTANRFTKQKKWA